jgi:hypothetical protein
MGRYTQPDPIGLAGGANRYAYAGNSPLMAVDRDGNFYWLVLPAVLAAADVGWQLYRNDWHWQCINPWEVATAALTGLGMPEGAFAEFAAEGAAAEGGTALSTFRYTQEGESFFHYGYRSQAENFAGGLRPGGYATDIGDLSGAEAQSGLALPHAAPPDAVYTVSPEPGTLVNVNPVARPQFGQAGGLPEFQFPLGTGPGTVSEPGSIP